MRKPIRKPRLRPFPAPPLYPRTCASTHRKTRWESTARCLISVGLLRLLKASQRDVKQTAYRILVASSTTALAANRGDLWDTGKAASSRIFGIAYAGSPMASQTRYYWKARIWDLSERPSPWSDPAAFTTGLFRPGDWTAHWIAAEPDGPPPRAREGEEQMTATPKPLPLFRHGFELHKRVTEALLFVSGLGQYEVRLNGQGITTAVLRPGWTDYRKRVS